MSQMYRTISNNDGCLTGSCCCANIQRCPLSGLSQHRVQDKENGAVTLKCAAAATAAAVHVTVVRAVNGAVVAIGW